MRTPLATLGLLLILAAAARGEDVVELRDGVLLQGRVLANGPGRVLLEADPGGLRFLARADVRRVSTGEGLAIPVLPSDPVGIFTVLNRREYVRRDGEELKPAVHGAAGVIREGDELHTGPHERTSFLLHDGSQLTAWSDAVVRFAQGAAELQTGMLRVRQPAGETLIRLPEGRLRVVEGEAQVQHLLGKTLLMTIGGRAALHGREGYRVDVHEQHAVEVTAESPRQPATVLAHNTNVRDLQLEFGSRTLPVRPGQLVVLFGAPPAAPPQAPPVAEPAPPVVAQQPPAPEPPGGPVVAGRVVRATGSFSLERPGRPVRRLEPAEAEGFALAHDDALETYRGTLALDAAGSRLELGPSSRLALGRAEGGPPLALRAGQLTLETSGRVSVRLPDGAAHLVAGRLGLQQGEDGLLVAGLRTGQSSLFLGDSQVVAELRAPCELQVRSPATGSYRLDLAPGGEPVPVTVGRRVDLVLRPNLTLAYRSLAGDRQELFLWNGAELELVGHVAARVVTAPDEKEYLELEDGRRVLLVAGRYLLVANGAAVDLARLPEGAAVSGGAARPVVSRPTPPEPRPGPPANPTAPEPEPAELAHGVEEHRLANGAVIRTRNWGPLVVRRQVGDDVEVEGQNGALWFGPRVRATLARRGAFARLETADGRFVVHERGAGRCDVRLAEDGRLTIEALDGLERRTIRAEPGTELDIAVRRDAYVMALVYGQVVYVEPGQELSITQSSGMRAQMARDRGQRSGER